MLCFIGGNGKKFSCLQTSFAPSTLRDILLTRMWTFLLSEYDIIVVGRIVCHFGWFCDHCFLLVLVSTTRQCGMRTRPTEICEITQWSHSSSRDLWFVDWCTWHANRMFWVSDFFVVACLSATVWVWDSET